MESEATKLRRTCGSRAQDDPGEGDGVLPVSQEGVPVQGDRGAFRRQPEESEFAVVERSVVLPVTACGRFLAQQNHAGARVPAAQLTGFLGVVGEEEVLHRMFLPG
jgi:hypothetical protein